MNMEEDDSNRYDDESDGYDEDENASKGSDDEDEGSETHQQQCPSPRSVLCQGPDDETLRILLSTDNHLGYAEKDPIRGLDSFAALEEILRLGRSSKCDLILFAGDFFHENKPSRRTMHKAIELTRTYCTGPNPVRFQVVSDQRSNFRSTNPKSMVVNYEDPFHSIDLPIFAIHGNHDDPTRDGGTEMLAALDVLAATNLINYFGRQDEVNQVEVSPVLIRKGSTKVALYGMGSMRDERLNRMWRDKKVRFLRPEEDDGNKEKDSDGSDDDDADENESSKNWFNIFALHQNRDLGRGSKNCVHESMIPEWMDLVVWGHEHECRIQPAESAVGTYRIVQPGSSVATSLTAGESVRKHVGLLDVRNSAFRVTAIPVRPFAVGEVVLSDVAARLGDPEDPRIDERISKLLSAEVNRLVAEAREATIQAKEDANKIRGGGCVDEETEGDDGNEIGHDFPPKFQIQEPNQVLVRLRVQHSGFPTLNNQRFGSRFVNEVANPADLLLFHRRREASTAAGGKKKTAAASDCNLRVPIEPDDLAEINVEELVKETLGSAKLQLLDEEHLGEALEQFVSKEQRAAIAESVDKLVDVQQRRLVRRGGTGSGKGNDGHDDTNRSDTHASGTDDDNGESEGRTTGDASGGGSKITTATALREVCAADAGRAGLISDDSSTGGVEMETKRRGVMGRRTTKKAPTASSFHTSSLSSPEKEPPKKLTRKKRVAVARTPRGRKEVPVTLDESDDDDDNANDEDEAFELVDSSNSKHSSTVTKGGRTRGRKRATDTEETKPSRKHVKIDDSSFESDEGFMPKSSSRSTVKATSKREERNSVAKTKERRNGVRVNRSQQSQYSFDHEDEHLEEPRDDVGADGKKRSTGSVRKRPGKFASTPASVSRSQGSMSQTKLSLTPIGGGRKRKPVASEMRTNMSMRRTTKKSYYEDDSDDDDNYSSDKDDGTSRVGIRSQGSSWGIATQNNRLKRGHT